MTPRTPTSPEPGALDGLGFERFRAAFVELEAVGLEPGRVVRTIRGHIWVATESGVMRVSPTGNLMSGGEPGSFPVVGDWVGVRPATETSSAMVEALLPRATCFMRRDPGKAAIAQVLAANVDVVFIVDGLDRGPNLRRIERELALAWESGARPVIVLSKSDLADDPTGAVVAVSTIAPGVDVVLESAETGEGLEELRVYASGNRTVALIGPSGVGKSTLTNGLAGGDLQSVGAVRAFDGKGRHTTVTRELVPLPGGGALLDTPGLRAFAMWDDEDGVDTTFSEISGLAAGCRFDDCSHETEPGCAVRAALDAGSLDPARYDAFIALRRESEFHSLESDARARELKKRGKTIAKAIKDYHKHEGR